MHLIEKYALNYNLKIDKPFIFEKFYPIGETKYISLHLGADGENARYPFWQEVINLSLPILQKSGINFIQSNFNLKQNYNNCSNLTEGKLSDNELAYLIKNSILHVCEGGLTLDFASYYDKNTILLGDTKEPFNDQPYWSHDSQFLNLKEEKIFPDKIAEQIFHLLGIEEAFDYETVFIGPNYLTKMIQFIPETDLRINNSSLPLTVRMDKVFNEENLVKQLMQHSCIIVTNKAINENIINKFSKNINYIAYFINENDDPSFIEKLRRANVSAILLSKLKEEEIEKKKLNYMDFGSIKKIENRKQNEIEELKDLDLSSLYYASNGPVLHNEKTYKSIFDWENGIQGEGFSTPSRIHPNDHIWDEIDSLYIVKDRKA